MFTDSIGRDAAIQMANDQSPVTKIWKSALQFGWVFPMSYPCPSLDAQSIESFGIALRTKTLSIHVQEVRGLTWIKSAAERIVQLELPTRQDNQALECAQPSAASCALPRGSNPVRGTRGYVQVGDGCCWRGNDATPLVDWAPTPG